MSDSMITVRFNAVDTTIETGSTVQTFIDKSGITGKRFIIVLNDEVVPKSQYETTLLNTGDALDVMSPITGG